MQALAAAPASHYRLWLVSKRALRLFGPPHVAWLEALCFFAGRSLVFAGLSQANSSVVSNNVASDLGDICQAVSLRSRIFWRHLTGQTSPSLAESVL